ncbi:UNVERIFIED_CONTAM: putative mitochondrial protein [Sesamum angustifolium]|uniref:Mitochondrial protein n=1 Tax=Sesamum angustifolium TaxID=2727405 RepID=A0AAW2N6I0_9LAMI
MSLITWNYQGLGGPWTVQYLGDLIRDYRPALVFVAETKCSSRHIDRLKRKFDMHGVSVDSRGKSGGLALLWSRTTDVLLQNYSVNHIDVSMKLAEDQDWWRFTGIYGEPDNSKRECTWGLLSRLRKQSNHPWLCAGDFNEILDHSEKLGGPQRPVWQIRRFREALADCSRQLQFSIFHSSALTIKLFLLGLKLSVFSQRANLSRGGLRRLGSNLHNANSVAKISGCGKGIEIPVFSINGLVTDSRQILSVRLGGMTVEDIALGTAQLLPVVTPSMAEELLLPYTEEEGSKALFQMASFKSPSLDGMPPIFFQSFWHIVHDDVTACVLKFLNSFHLPPRMNDTHIVLIPKCKHPELLSQFRPISLCNVIYKIASKTIANRLKVILDKIISPAQSAFVPGRLITDNILLAFELNHFLNTKSKGAQGFMALKLDVSKAYDKVEWPFLEQVLFCLGFPSPFIRLIMLCISSISYSFLLGGHQFSSIRPSRGLRQGDLLSPYLFLLCTESFSSLLQQTEQVGRIPGVSICRRAPSISHLLFADDTLIFSRASTMVACEILTVLDIYRRASGHEINFAKSSVAFSRNTKEEVRQTTAGTLCIRRENEMELYLGFRRRWLGRRRISLALFEIESGGVFQGGMRSYSPKQVRKCLSNMLFKRFLLMPWAVFVCLLRYYQIFKECKLKGGLGFRQLSLFNIAMLAKQLWRILKHPNRLLSRVLRARYFPNSDIFSASSGWRPSFTWRSLMAAQSLFRAGCRWRVGSRSSIRVWNDPWLPRPISFKPITPPPPSSMNLRVLDFIDSSLGDSDRAKIDEMFWPEDKEVILGIPLVN